MTKPKSGRKRFLNTTLKRQVIAPDTRGQMAAVLRGDLLAAHQVFERAQEKVEDANSRVVASFVYGIDCSEDKWQDRLIAALMHELGWFREPPKTRRAKKGRNGRVFQRVLTVLAQQNLNNVTAACEHLVDENDALVSQNPKLTGKQRVAELVARFYDGRREQAEEDGPGEACLGAGRRRRSEG